jgi:hypothetical protein
MLQLLSEISALLNTSIPGLLTNEYAQGMIDLSTKCENRWTDFLVLVLSGGTITGVLQIISDLVGNKRLKEMYKESQDKIHDQAEKIEFLYTEKEDFKDALSIIKAQIEMCEKQNLKCDFVSYEYIKHLTEEMLKTIEKVSLDNKTIIPGINNK